ncbi:MAG: VOC family protein [Bacillota bacterium]|nr:VOC family protein [Bacillota bacterium]
MKLCWCTIHVDDMAAAKAFYGDFLGLKEVNAFSPQEGTSIVFYSDENGVQVELIHNGTAPAEKSAANVSLGMRTACFDTLLQKANDRGLTVSGPMVLGKDMECFFVNDPNGVGIQVIRG